MVVFEQKTTLAGNAFQYTAVTEIITIESLWEINCKIFGEFGLFL